MIEYTHGGWMPPQHPSASWCATIHSTPCFIANARSGLTGSFS